MYLGFYRVIDINTKCISHIIGVEVCCLSLELNVRKHFLLLEFLVCDGTSIRVVDNLSRLETFAGERVNINTHCSNRHFRSHSR